MSTPNTPEKPAAAPQAPATVTLPPLPEINPNAPMPPELRQTFQEMWRNRFAEYRASPVMGAAQSTPLSDDEIETITQFVETGTTDLSKICPVVPSTLSYDRIFEVILLQFAELPDVKLLHVVRLMMVMKYGKRWYRGSVFQNVAAHHLKTHKPNLGLRELAANLVVVKRLRRDVGDLIFAQKTAPSPLLEFDSSDIWPYFSANITVLDEAAVAKFDDKQEVEAHRVRLLEVFNKLPKIPERYQEICWESAFGNSKKELPLAQTRLDNVPGSEDKIIAALGAGKAGQRVTAAQWLGRSGYKGAVPALKEALAKEKQDDAKRAMTTALAKLGAEVEEPALTEGGAAVVERAAEATLELTPVATVEAKVPLTAEARQALAALLAKAEKTARAHLAKMPPGLQMQANLSIPDLGRIVNVIEGMGEDPYDSSLLHPHIAVFGSQEAVRFVVRPDVELIHAMRFAVLLGQGSPWMGQLQQCITAHAAAHTPRYGLREVAATMKALGWDEQRVGERIVELSADAAYSAGFQAEGIWPYFAEHPELLEDALAPKERVNRTELLSNMMASGKMDLSLLQKIAAGAGASSLQGGLPRERVFEILAMFPQLPSRFQHICWDIALNGASKERLLAQAALANLTDKETRITASLAAGKADPRAAAAQWLGRLRSKEAIPALRKALASEKQEAAAGEMMSALEKMGVPLAEFINVEGLLKECKALLGRGVPKEMEWFPMALLPAVRWAADGERVAPEIIQWVVLSSYKAGSPEPGAKLRQYAAYFNRADADALGQFVLDAWIAQDTATCTHDEAHKYAEEYAQARLNYQQRQAARAQQLGPNAPSAVLASQIPVKSHDEWYREGYNQKIAEPIGSAIKDKGILAVAGACCGRGAAVPVERYLKTYYGQRAAQCKALLQMLSWIDHPAAIQVLLATASRFRTPSIRKEAEKCAEQLSERRNWTVEEMADRTIPTGGLDESQTLTLDYGQRQFVGRLDAEGKIALEDGTGKPIKALPDARQDDEAEKVKAAKAELATAKKEITSTLKLQEQRLYEAMCTQRTWPFADWDQFLNRHVIMRTYCQRLVWGVVEDGKVTLTFRPLEDGSLSDTADQLVTVGPDQRIVLAHSCNVNPETADAWTRHLVDYGVAPLFVQFGSSFYQLPEEQRHESSLDEFQGHMVESFKLRGRLTKLGYTRGPVGDGGSFYTYERTVAALGLRTVVEFSGTTMPEHNIPVALYGLYFGRGEQRVPLGQIPPVLLSEAWNDLRAAAQEGTGFDAEWENKVQ